MSDDVQRNGPLPPNSYLPTGSWDPTIFPTSHSHTPHNRDPESPGCLQAEAIEALALPHHYRSHHPDLMRPYPTPPSSTFGHLNPEALNTYRDAFDDALDEPPGPPTDEV